MMKVSMHGFHGCISTTSSLLSSFPPFWWWTSLCSFPRHLFLVFHPHQLYLVVTCKSRQVSSLSLIFISWKTQRRWGYHVSSLGTMCFCMFAMYALRVYDWETLQNCRKSRVACPSSFPLGTAKCAVVVVWEKGWDEMNVTMLCVFSFNGGGSKI